MQLQRPDLPRLGRLEDHPEGEPVRDVADDHAADREHPPVRQGVGDEDERDAEEEPEEEAEVDDEAQLPLPDLEEDPVPELGVLLDCADHHQLHVEELVDVGADLVGDLVDDVGELLLDPRVDGVAHPLGDVVPEVGVLALHRPLDHLADVVAGRGQDLLGDLVGLELLVEVRRAADLGDALVDRDRAHLRGARGDDPLPADAALHHAGDLLDPARQHVRELRQARELHPLELDRVEEHQDAAPVRDVADRAREERNRQRADRLGAHLPAASYSGGGGARAGVGPLGSGA